MADKGTLRRLLLGMLGPACDARGLAALSDRNWDELGAMSAQHRLRPHLHARLSRGELKAPLPARLRADWQEAHRNSAIAALVQRRELLATSALLEEAGFAPVGLKGALLAWHAYPAPAERPARDCDLLLPEEQAVPAYELLLRRGYAQLDGAPGPLADLVDRTKHLPALRSPGGVVLEVHMHAWEPAQSMEWAMPPLADAQLIARARRIQGDPLRYLSPEDMLAHLAVHAVYDHRFDAGPLLLADVDYLIARNELDWPLFWRQAAAGGWRRGAALVLALTDRWRRPGLLAESGCTVSVPDRLIASSSELLLQDLATRRATGMLAGLGEAWREDGVSGLARRASRRLTGRNRARDATSGKATRSFSGWLASHGAERLRQAVDPETRAAAARSVALGEWLAAPDGHAG